METQKTLCQRLKILGIGALVTVLYFSPAAIAVYENSKFVGLGEGFSVRKRGNQREFYIGTSGYGLARLCLDKDGNGTLDETQVNMPIGPFMGGPGYRLIKTQTTNDDRKKFARANYLYNLNENEGN